MGIVQAAENGTLKKMEARLLWIEGEGSLYSLQRLGEQALAEEGPGELIVNVRNVWPETGGLAIGGGCIGEPSLAIGRESPP